VSQVSSLRDRSPVSSIRDDVHLPQLLNLENWKELEHRKFSFEICSAEWLQIEGGA
jgi:hypothetical protein